MFERFQGLQYCCNVRGVSRGLQLGSHDVGEAAACRTAVRMIVVEFTRWIIGLDYCIEENPVPKPARLL